MRRIDKRFLVLASLVVMTVAPMVGIGRAQQEQITAVADDELAPVRDFRARLHERLGENAAILDMDLIMEGPQFSGTRPSAVRWDGRGERVWLQWKRWDEERTGTWEYRVADGSLQRLSDAEAERVPSPRAVWDRDHQMAMWTVRDSLMFYDSRADRVRVLVHGLGVRPVAFSGDGKVGVVRQRNNLLTVALDADSGQPAVARLTDIRPGRAAKVEPSGASQRWLRDQQLSLFDVLERREALRLERQDEARAGQPEPLYLAGWEVANLVVSPDLQWVAVFQRQESSDDRVADVPNYVTTSGYTEDISARTKVGDALDSTRVGIVHVGSGRFGVVDLALDERAVNFQGLQWSDDSGRGLLQVRSRDDEDRWFAVLSPALETPEAVADTEGGAEQGEAEPESDDAVADDAAADDAAAEEAEVEPLYIGTVLAAHDHDDAWINWAVAGGWGWLPQGDHFYFVSERDGSMHLYSAAAGGGEPTALTAGDFEVFAPRLHPDRQALVFEASIDSPFQVHAYRLALQGGEPLPITGAPGRQDVVLSPDGSRLASVESSSNRPPELWLRQQNAATATARRVTESPSPAFESYDWIEPEIVHFTARDGVEVPARLYKPETPHPSRPAVIFVHGAGYLHNVHRWWSSYSREYTFHHLLMERGYTVLDIDYRGSAGYGRDWRTAIYRYMGGKDLDDNEDGARYLVSEHGIDPQRIGLYGGSYGGFITLMALFTRADSFAAGAALRPVTDWAHYNHGYTNNILNSPQDDPESYWKSSPIYLAEGLEDPLLIAHGVVDTNVHFQGVVRLAQRLIELRKENWEVAMYPVENHGFVEPSSWADEYRRIFKLFEQNLK